MSITKCLRAGTLVLALTAMAVTPAVAAADTEKVRAYGDSGWTFARDAANASPFTFTVAARTIGAGSLLAGPISATPAHKFVAELPLGIPTSDLQSVSYDYLIAGAGLPSDAGDYYLNVYTFYPTPVNTFFDCRYDYTPASGSTTAFTTASFAATDIPADARERNGATPTCPATLDQMPAGSTISFLSLNIGDTGAGDSGLAGYFDNVVVSTAGGSTTYDFDPSKDACKGGGFAVGGFANQGLCVSAAT